jgi:hypothetical protein
MNADGYVNNLDLAVLGSQWQKMDCGPCNGSDITGDGNVNMDDLLVIANDWLTDFTLLGHWRFDGNALDSSGYMKDATVAGDAVWQPEGGQVDGALLLDGLNDYVSTPFVLDPAVGVFSVFAWIKGGAPSQVIISQKNGVNWLMADADEGTLRTELTIPAVTARGKTIYGPPLVSSALFTDGDWHRIGFVWDGSNRILYTDDIEVGRDESENLAPNEGGLIFGAGAGLNEGSFFSGLIDDIRIYNRVVSP